MNSGLQCIANSPFIKEFFTESINAETGKDGDNSLAYWKFQVNTTNVMGYKGEFV